MREIEGYCGAKCMRKNNLPVRVEFYFCSDYFSQPVCDRKVSKSGWRGAETPPPALRRSTRVSWPRPDWISYPVRGPLQLEGTRMPSHAVRSQCPACSNRLRYAHVVFASVQAVSLYRSRKGRWKCAERGLPRAQTRVPLCVLCAHCNTMLPGIAPAISKALESIRKGVQPRD